MDDIWRFDHHSFYPKYQQRQHLCLFFLPHFCHESISWIGGLTLEHILDAFKNIRPCLPPDLLFQPADTEIDITMPNSIRNTRPRLLISHRPGKGKLIASEAINYTQHTYAHTHTHTHWLEHVCRVPDLDRVQFSLVSVKL